MYDEYYQIRVINLSFTGSVFISVPTRLGINQTFIIKRFALCDVFTIYIAYLESTKIS